MVLQSTRVKKMAQLVGWAIFLRFNLTEGP
jgi:hypothetical protein